MKKLEKRGILCLLLAAFLVLGTGVFAVRLGLEGSQWASYYANRHVFHEGTLSVGTVYDRNGSVLLKNDKKGQHYHEDSAIRTANLHVTGDKASNIATGANVAFRSKMIGYNFITGTKGIFFGAGREATLTVDAGINLVAYQALAGRNGLVSVYNWKTGEIICLVSSPSFDPMDDYGAANAKSGAYINKTLSATLTPGSIFKLVTTAAAIERMPDLDSWSFTCDSRYEIEGGRVTCGAAHGTQDIRGALTNSCNCAYAAITRELGPEILESYVKKLGLTDSYDINGIKTAKGSFHFDEGELNCAWSGIGQHEDLVNPLSMMVYVGAIAGGGSAAEPILLKGSHSGAVDLLAEDTAKTLKSMMRNNVKAGYGDDNFPGLKLCAKTGTAEVGSGKRPHGWFTGFSGHYAFIVCVENGGSGIGDAAPVANQVLQAIKKAEKDQ
ncbi:MAG: penicillin-binding protein [Firmicutes bacterium]|nr:penicillin-binding protein [Bacillota bacterium]